MYVCRSQPGFIMQEFRQEFTPSQLVDELRRTHKRKLYAVIDLTNTSKYYDPKVSVNKLNLKVN